MSAHLTVYTMAFAAEQPLRMRDEERARHLADAAAAPGQRADALLRRIGAAIRRFRGSGVTADRWAGSGPGGCRVVDHLNAFSARGLILECNDRAASGTT